jgi:hypothetical protein
MPQVCTSGYAGPQDGAASATLTCQPGPVNTNPVTTGVAAGTTCPVTLTATSGAVIKSTTTPQCGYNLDANFYCPWQIGDSAPQTAMAALGAVYKYAASNCNPSSAGVLACAAVAGQFKTVATTYLQGFWFINGIADIGPLIVNNGKCVQSSITYAFYASAVSIYSMIGSIFVLVSLMI